MLLELLACSEMGKNQDELQLNVVAACTNLTFYSCRVCLNTWPKCSSSNLYSMHHLKSLYLNYQLENQSAGGEGALSPSLPSETTRDLQSMATRLANYLFHENPEVVLEAARALGAAHLSNLIINVVLSTLKSFYHQGTLLEAMPW